MQIGRSGLPSERAPRGYCAVPWLAFALGFLAAPTLSAQERPLSGAAAATDALDAPAATGPESNAAGAELYKQAESHYVAGDVSGALGLMQRAYAASERPELLFNLGQLHRELHHCREARESYEGYLALARNGTRREEAERSRSELALQCPARAAGAAPLAAEPERVKSYWTPMRIAGWSTIGGSVLLGATAGYFALNAHHLQNELESDIQEAKSTGSPYVAAYGQLEDEGHHQALVARGLAVTALGVAAIGVSLLVFSPGEHDAGVNTVSVRCTVDGAKAVYTGSF